MSHRFTQVDVFSASPTRGNALAVVHDADDLTDDDMAAFARWTNLSETTFLLKPTVPDADYRLRIFTPLQELPFAGHPTLGSCHAWLRAGGKASGDRVVQQCAAGLIEVRREDDRLAFKAPPLVRSGAVEPEIFAKALDGTGLTPETVVDAAWVDNGPGWMGLLLRSSLDVLAIKPDFPRLKGMRVGVIGPVETGDGTDCDFEVRAFTAAGFEDAATGSLNAGLAVWLTGNGHAPNRYVAAQGTMIGRKARLHVTRDGGEIWLGGHCHTVISGKAEFETGTTAP
ncbi:PhzF family phenazine biosynthesis protein [Rhizobium sp. SL86]|uniref:PhzF family phenazine biosynthesis protein n=1 Tax=Rhizobium sp. SL86 TaxID=2995148 RepID=UPI00227540AF|nr:PhzF family phenazine biosynthesis protein [Rhizobium sp. SL86]MCY1669193.1 PhzF family phenazine biosynthesis protein [Rhizobium sp. SL86]